MLRFYWRSIIRKHLWQTLFIAALMLTSAIFQMGTIGLMVPLLEAVSNGGNTAPSWVLDLFRSALRAFGLVPTGNLIVFAVLVSASLMFVAYSGFMLVHQYLSSAAAEMLRRDTKLSLFQSFLFCRYDDIAQRGRGAILQDLNGPPSAAYTAIIRLSSLSTALLNVVTMLFLMLYLSWWATLLIGLLAIAGIYGTRQMIDRRSAAAGREIYRLQTEQSRLAVDSIDGIKIVKAYALEDRISNSLRTLLQAEIGSSLRLAFFRYLPAFLNEFAASIIVLILGGIALLRPSVGMSFPTLVAFLMAIRQCGAATATINSTIAELQTLRRSVEILDEVLEVLPPEKSGTRPVKNISKLRLVNVSLHYRSRQQVLEDINLTLKKGTVTALVGSTGAGKSSIANLITGLYQPSSGSILVDGVNLNDLNLVQWRQRLGYVSQDIFLFNTSIRNNIGLWNESVSQAEIEWAAGLAQLDDFVATLPEGYETQVGDRGLKLSGGQCQRIAIARAVILKPEVLLFDEATSALDNLTEKAVYEAMSALRQDAIVMAVAHRLSTIRDADQIIVLEGGRIVEAGTHESLILERGSYSKLYETESVRG
ncbi:MAG TPA: ABC transporter ATP-binding protein [Terriglobia bacterium]|nr:ABC transporter ATP-binding protein [Terriglobia bacterium]